MKYQFTVILGIYNPNRFKTFSALNSIIKQKNINFELIIVDDGSVHSLYREIVEFLDENNFSNYKFVENKSNQGIVKNLLSGLKISSGKYIKVVFPGDYLYDDQTLYYAWNFMEEREAILAFGDAVYYNNVGKLNIFDNSNPNFKDLYCETKEYDYNKILKYQLIFEDFILGTSVFYKLEEYKEILEIFALNGIKYLEDAAMIVMAVKKYRIYKMERFVIWYDFGTGITTNVNLNFSKKIDADKLKVLQYLNKNYYSIDYVKRAYKKNLFSVKDNRILREIKKSFELDCLIYRYKRKYLIKNRKCTGYDIQKYYEWTRLLKE